MIDLFSAPRLCVDATSSKAAMIEIVRLTPLPPILGMALCAQIVDGLEVHEMAILGAVGAMTALAAQREVSVSRILDLLSDGVRRMRLPFVAVLAELEKRRLLHQEEIVGAVGRVALAAFALGNRGVLGL